MIYLYCQKKILPLHWVNAFSTRHHFPEMQYPRITEMPFYLRAKKHFDKRKIMKYDNIHSGRGNMAWAVDAACSGNPGPMEYQGVDLATGKRVFHYGPIRGTNNIGEFLAIVHALALMEQRNMKGYTIYSDSLNAQLWVRKQHCATKLPLSPETQHVHELVTRAENWLRTHEFRVPIVKWDTKEWGEIPADFGRK